MKFARDLLLIDIQTTGPSHEKDFPLQIAAVYLDKDNLLEKGSFNSYIRHPFSQTTNDRVMQTLNIQKELWMTAPNLKTVVKSFQEKFPFSVTIASHNIQNVQFLQEAYKKVGLPYEFDNHVLELWTLGYMYLCKQNIKKIPTAETIGSYLKLKKSTENDALANARFLSEILRKLSIIL
jgi:DNA polymerase III alpha subunit (gram-positive type)